VTPIRATVGGDLILWDLPPKPLERLRRALSYPNDAYVRAKRMNLPLGTKPERVECMIEMPDGRVHVPRGALALVNETLDRDDYVVKVTQDLRSVGTPLALSSFLHTPDMSEELHLRDYQREAVAAVRERVQGLVIFPCGAGKSRTMIGVIAALRRSAIIIVPSNDLADQWKAEIQRLLLITPGFIGAGTCDYEHDIVIAIDDSLVRMLENDPFFDDRRFGIAIVDECHRVPARTLQAIVRGLSAKWRVGTTATNLRTDSAGPLIPWSFGPVLLERTTREMIALGWLMPADIELLESGWTFRYTGPEEKRIARMEAALVRDVARNNLIADRAAKEAQNGETVLVLSNRRAHTKKLAELIEARNVAAIALTSGDTKRKRKESIQALREGSLPVMVATSLADTGLDIPSLSRVILAFPQRARGGTVQRLGRLLRDFEGKKPKLIDICDQDVPTLKSRAQARARVYREAGLLRE
jgi:superfamily II DNA or RNA helicase